MSTRSRSCSKSRANTKTLMNKGASGPPTTGASTLAISTTTSVPVTVSADSIHSIVTSSSQMPLASTCQAIPVSSGQNQTPLASSSQAALYSYPEVSQMSVAMATSTAAWYSHPEGQMSVTMVTSTAESRVMTSTTDTSQMAVSMATMGLPPAVYNVAGSAILSDIGPNDMEMGHLPMVRPPMAQRMMSDDYSWASAYPPRRRPTSMFPEDRLVRQTGAFVMPDNRSTEAIPKTRVVINQPVQDSVGANEMSMEEMEAEMALLQRRRALIQMRAEINEMEREQQLK